MSRPHLALIAGLALACVGCDFDVLSSRSGEHVVYHWDASERTLCGETVRDTDRLAETMVAHYGMSIEHDDGPTIDYFWDLDDLETSVCSGAQACVSSTRTSSDRWLASLFSDRTIHGHELAHAVLGARDHGIPMFFNEGLADRWESSALGGSSLTTQPLTLDEAQLRTQLDSWTTIDTGDYVEAYSWVAALEVTYGPAKMAELMRSLHWLSSADAVDDALRRVMGISLAESVTLAAHQPPLSFDDPVCDFAGLPTLEWEGAKLILDQQEARCGDEDVINWKTSRFSKIFFVNFPGEPVNVRVTVNGPRNSLFILDRCHGRPLAGERIFTHFAAKRVPDDPRRFSGRHVANLVGDLGADGTVTFPGVVIELVQP